MLQVICHTTGMGFAAVAKVTSWVACGVRDQIDFGLQSGGELDVKSTICNEIRDSHQAVIIDNVDQDPNSAIIIHPSNTDSKAIYPYPSSCRTASSSVPYVTRRQKGIRYPNPQLQGRARPISPSFQPYDAGTFT